VRGDLHAGGAQAGVGGPPLRRLRRRPLLGPAGAHHPGPSGDHRQPEVLRELRDLRRSSARLPRPATAQAALLTRPLDGEASGRGKPRPYRPSPLAGEGREGGKDPTLGPTQSAPGPRRPCAEAECPAGAPRPELSSVTFCIRLRGGWTRISTPERGPSSPATWRSVALPPAVSSAKYSWKLAATAPKTTS